MYQLQTPQSFAQSIQELLIGLQRTGDPGGLVELRAYFELLAEIDATQGGESGDFRVALEFDSEIFVL